jgi:hypothetical protein
MHRFLSWDCGNKTLAHAHVSINTMIFVQLQQMQSQIDQWLMKYEKNDPFGEWMRINRANVPVHNGQGPINIINTRAITELMQILNHARSIISSFIAFHSVGVTDILDGKKVADTDEVERTIALYKFLESSTISLASLSREDKTYNQTTEILVEHQPSRVGMATNNKSTMVGHQLMFYYVGRKVSLVSPKLKNQIGVIAYTPTYGSAATPYYARKKHSKDTFLQIMNTLNLQYVYGQISMSCMDDLADAVLQIFAHCKEKKLMVRPN